jgi:hypothetical protein
MVEGEGREGNMRVEPVVMAEARAAGFTTEAQRIHRGHGEEGR